MSGTSVIVHSDPDDLAEAAAARLIVTLVEAQAARGIATLVVTGGGIASRVHRRVRDLPARDAVDWAHVDVWWGDDRFLPFGHPERNETQVRADLLDVVPVDPARIHPMYPSDGPDGDDPEAAAARYAADLARAARPGTAPLPHFDLIMLGVGEEGHVASIFPESPAVYDTRMVVAVLGCPKPPPVRISMTLPTINTASEVWLVAAGPEKASAVGLALTGPGAVQLPAAGVHGVDRTIWMLDRSAAAEVPVNLRALR
jgi:6-phosphogluconolactonase